MASTTVSATPPEPISWRSPADLKRVGKELWGEFKKDNVTSLAAAFAYHTVFAIPALLILTVTMAGLVNMTTDVDVTGNLRELIAERAPADTRALLNGIVDNAVADVSGGGASLGVALTALLALWSGSNAVGALVDAFNRAYGVQETRTWVRKKALTLALTLLLALFINVAFALLVFGGRIGTWLADRVGLGSAFEVAWNLARWPIAVAAVALVLAVLYYLGPNVEQTFRWVSPGSVLSTVLWLVATAGIGIYLTFSNPGSAYGAVGSVLVLLFFLYVTGIVFLLGAELNAMVGKRYDPATIDDLAARSDVDLRAKLEAQATQGQGGTEGEGETDGEGKTDGGSGAVAQGAGGQDGLERLPRRTPPAPTGRGYGGAVAAAGSVALAKGVGVLGRLLQRRRSG